MLSSYGVVFGPVSGTSLPQPRPALNTFGQRYPTLTPARCCCSHKLRLPHASCPRQTTNRGIWPWRPHPLIHPWTRSRRPTDGAGWADDIARCERSEIVAASHPSVPSGASLAVSSAQDLQSAIAEGDGPDAQGREPYRRGPACTSSLPAVFLRARGPREAGRSEASWQSLSAQSDWGRRAPIRCIGGSLRVWCWSVVAPFRRPRRVGCDLSYRPGPAARGQPRTRGQAPTSDTRQPQRAGREVPWPPTSLGSQLAPGRRCALASAVHCEDIGRDLTGILSRATRPTPAKLAGAQALAPW